MIIGFIGWMQFAGSYGRFERRRVAAIDADYSEGSKHE